MGWTNARFHDFSSTTQVEELRNRDDSSEGRIGNPFVRGSGLEIPVRESRVAYVFVIPCVGSRHLNRWLLRIFIYNGIKRVANIQDSLQHSMMQQGMTPRAHVQTARFMNGSSRYRLCLLAPCALIMTSKPRSCFDAPRAADTVEYDFSITLSPRDLEHRRSQRTRRVPAPVATATPVEIGSHFSSSSKEMVFSLAALRKLLDETPPAEDDLQQIVNEPSAPYSGVHRGYTCDFEEPVRPAHWQSRARIDEASEQGSARQRLLE